MKKKSNLKGKKIYVKEDLTKWNLSILRAARERNVKAWSTDGKILTVDKGKIIRLTSIQDVDNLMNSVT